MSSMNKYISDYINSAVHHVYNSSIAITTTHELRCITWNIVRNVVDKEISKAFTVIKESLEQ